MAATTTTQIFSPAGHKAHLSPGLMGDFGLILNLRYSLDLQAVEDIGNALEQAGATKKQLIYLPGGDHTLTVDCPQGSLQGIITALRIQFLKWPSEFNTADIQNMESAFLQASQSAGKPSTAPKPAPLPDTRSPFQKENDIHTGYVVAALKSKHAAAFPDADEIGKALNACKNAEEVAGVYSDIATTPLNGRMPRPAINEVVEVKAHKGAVMNLSTARSAAITHSTPFAITNNVHVAEVVKVLKENNTHIIRANLIGDALRRCTSAGDVGAVYYDITHGHNGMPHDPNIETLDAVKAHKAALSKLASRTP